MDLFHIAGTFFKIKIAFDLPSCWNNFKFNFCEKWDLEINSNLLANTCYNLSHFKLSSNGILLKGIDGGLMVVNPVWTEAELQAKDYEQSNSLILTQLYSYLVTRRTLLMHSSLIDFQGNGIMFLGPSGIGKTTQAELWNQFAGADILNGDMVFVRENPDGFYGYGSPWHGSSPYCMNAKVKLRALITLEQASENSIRRLSGFDVLQGIMDQVFLPHWYPEGMTPCLDTLNDLLAQIPVYHLACRPDEDAVQLLKNELQI